MIYTAYFTLPKSKVKLGKFSNLKTLKLKITCGCKVLTLNPVDDKIDARILLCPIHEGKAKKDLRITGIEFDLD